MARPEVANKVDENLSHEADDVLAERNNVEEGLFPSQAVSRAAREWAAVAQLDRPQLVLRENIPIVTSIVLRSVVVSRTRDVVEHGFHCP